MADTVQFVDAIASSPNLRLDINDGAIWGVDYNGTDLSPPPLRRAYAQTLLVDGARVPAAAYDLRTVRLRLELRDSSVDSAATRIQTLMREMNRDGNILKWQPGTTAPVFFRTMRSSTDRITEVPGSGTYKTFDLSILAEPFALGLKETVTPITVSNDPAAVSNGCFFDLASVKGDVETPLILELPTTSRGAQSLFAVRRRGTPSSAPGFLQAEAMTNGTDTTIQANDAGMSGAGQNFKRTTFATPGWAIRLSIGEPWPASASVNSRGTYRVFARVRKNTSGDVMQARLTYGADVAASPLITNDAVTIDTAETSAVTIDLGLLTIPVGVDPVYDGYSGTEIPARGIYIALEATRTSGSGTLDWDFVSFIPADDRLCITEWNHSATAADRLILDGSHDAAYAIIDATGELVSRVPGSTDGGFIMISPAQTNRIYHLNEVTPGVTEPVFPTTWSFEPFYFPRYLYVRPATT